MEEETNDSKIDFFEDDDEFEEFFEMNQEKWHENEEKQKAQQWEDDWDDDVVNVDSSVQLKKEQETAPGKS